MRLLYGRDDDVLSFVNQMIDEQFDRRDSVGTGIVDAQGRLVAGWVWHNWSPEAEIIEFSGASTTPKWMTRAILHQLFSYPFEQLDCQMIVTRNSEFNTRLHRQLNVFGFDRFDIPRLFGRDEGGVVWTLTVEAWRASKYYKKDPCNGQKISTRAA